MTDDDRDWLHRVADALDKAERHAVSDPRDALKGAVNTLYEPERQMLTVSISDELAKGVSDRLRAIASAP